MGVKRSLQGWGVLLSVLANVFTILSTVTNYWIRHEKGHSGLWQDCTQGQCSNISCQRELLTGVRPHTQSPPDSPPPPPGHRLPYVHLAPGSPVPAAMGTLTTILVAGACMVLSGGFGVVAMVMGLRILCRADESLRGQTTSALLFVNAPGRAHLASGRGPGLLLMMALTSYTAGSARKDDAFFSWSYFSGWLALPFHLLAGCCFLLADMILQSAEAIGGFPVCL
ncbi:claudin domain-containing protein 2 [Erethizon dorsatum]